MTPSSPKRARMWKSDRLAVDRRVVELEVAGVDDVPTGVRSARPMASGIEWPTRKGMTVNGPSSTLVARARAR
jgi:hypothetical protein